MRVLFALLLSFIIFPTSAQVTFDTTFGTNGIAASTNISQDPLRLFYENDHYYVALETNGVCSRNFDGSVNTAFGSGGTYYFNSTGQNDYVKYAKLHNGFLYLFGATKIGTSTQEKAFVVKISLAGVPDPTFGTNGKANLDFGYTDEGIKDLLITDTGELYGAGYSNKTMLVCKITPSGTLDTSFNSTGYRTYPLNNPETSSAASIFLQGGELLIMGASVFGPNIVGGVKYAVLLKTDLAGNPISSYGSNGKKLFELAPSSMLCSRTVKRGVIGDDGNYYLYFTQGCQGFAGAYIAKYNPSTDVFVTQFLSSVPDQYCDYSIDSSGKTFLTGMYSCSTWSGSTICSRKATLLKKNADGTPDLTFNGTGNFTYAVPPVVNNEDYTMAYYRHADGRVVTAGRTNNQYSAFGFAFAMMRLYDNPTTPSLDVADISKNDGFKLFPNPVGSELFIQNQNQLLVTGISIQDVYGNLVYVKKGPVSPIEVSNLSAGLYFLTISTEDKDVTLKVLKK